MCKCVLYYCHRVATQLQLTNMSYHTRSWHIVWNYLWQLLIPPNFSNVTQKIQHILTTKECCSHIQQNCLCTDISLSKHVFCLVVCLLSCLAIPVLLGSHQSTNRKVLEGTIFIGRKRKYAHVEISNWKSCILTTVQPPRHFSAWTKRESCSVA